MSLTLHREDMLGLWPELTPLIARHWEEIATWHDIPLDPDVERYNQMDALGFIRAYTARRDRTLIGYAIFSLAANMHYRSTKIAVQDVLFVVPEHRASGAGLALIGYANECLKNEQVVLVLQHQKVEHPALGVVLRKLGYRMIENIWALRLDKGD